MIIDGKKEAQLLRDEIKKEIDSIKLKDNNVPGLAVILIGDSAPSQIYVKNKEKNAKEVGISSEVIRYPKEILEQEVLKKIRELNHNNAVSGILVQLPLPPQINKEKIINAIEPLKDLGVIESKQGTQITFKPDKTIFVDNHIFSPEKIYKILEYKAYLVAGVQIDWKCHSSLLTDSSIIPTSKKLCFLDGLSEYMHSKTSNTPMYTTSTFKDNVKIEEETVEWAVRWLSLIHI